MLYTIIIGLIITVLGGVIVSRWTKIYLLLKRLLKKLGCRLKLIFSHKETEKERKEREAEEEQEEKLEEIFGDEGWKDL